MPVLCRNCFSCSSDTAKKAIPLSDFFFFHPASVQFGWLYQNAKKCLLNGPFFGKRWAGSVHFKSLLLWNGTVPYMHAVQHQHQKSLNPFFSSVHTEISYTQIHLRRGHFFSLSVDLNVSLWLPLKLKI